MTRLLIAITACTLGLNATPVFGQTTDPYACEVAMGLVHRDAGLGPRGFVGTAPHLSSVNLAALRERDIIPWNERIFVVKNEDDAHRLNWANGRLASLPHAELKPPEWLERSPSATDAALFAALAHQLSVNPLQRGLYVIDRHVKLEAMDEAARAAFFSGLPERPIYELDDQGRMTRLDPALVRERLDPAAMKLGRTFAFEPRHVVHAGFFAPRFRAMATLAAVPTLVAAERTAQVARYGDTLVAELFEVNADHTDRELRAALEGEVRHGVLYLDSASYAPTRGAELTVLLSLVRDDLLKADVHLVDTTKVWELHREPWTHMVPRDQRLVR